MHLEQPHGSNAEEMYPAIDDEVLERGEAWPRWKRTLSDCTTLYSLGFKQIDDHVYKRTDDNGLVLYLSTPCNAFERLHLKACYVSGKVNPSYCDIIGGEGRYMPVLAEMLLNGRCNSDIACAMFNPKTFRKEG